MPATFHWLAADRSGRLAKFDAERWATIPRAAPLLLEDDRGRLWNALHRAWVEQVAPLQVFEHQHLTMIPESNAPHLVAFAGTPPPLAGGTRVSDRVLSFERPSAELRARIEAQVAADDAGEELAGDGIVVGTLALDQDSFGERAASVLFRYSRWGNDPKYRRIDPAPAFQLRFEEARDLLRLDVDFTVSDSIDVSQIFAPDLLFELGK